MLNNIMHNLKDLRIFIVSLKGKKVLLIIGIVLVELLIFHAGVVVGSHRHSHRRDGDRFGFRPAPGFSEVRMPRGFMEEGHGVVGIIEKATAATLTLQMRDGSTQTVLLNPTTAVRDRSNNASSTALTAGQEIIVLGVPNDDGTISADLIRTISNEAQPLK